MVSRNFVEITRFLLRCQAILVFGSFLATLPVTAEETCKGPKFNDIGLSWGEGVTVKVNIDPIAFSENLGVTWDCNPCLIAVE